MRLTSTENGAVFCSTIVKNVGIITACVAIWVLLALIFVRPPKVFLILLLRLPLEMLPCNATELAG